MNPKTKPQDISTKEAERKDYLSVLCSLLVTFWHKHSGADREKELSEGLARAWCGFASFRHQ